MRMLTLVVWPPSLTVHWNVSPFFAFTPPGQAAVTLAPFGNLALTAWTTEASALDASTFVEVEQAAAMSTRHDVRATVRMVVRGMEPSRRRTRSSHASGRHLCGPIG